MPEQALALSTKDQVLPAKNVRDKNILLPARNVKFFPLKARPVSIQPLPQRPLTHISANITKVAMEMPEVEVISPSSSSTTIPLTKEQAQQIIAIFAPAEIQ